jgi:glycosyltransferase involved in cell wall biosynthesis
MNSQSVLQKYRPTIVVYSPYLETHACADIRIIAPLVANNCKIIWGVKRDQSRWSFDLESASIADLIIVQRHFPAVDTEKFIDQLLKLNVPIAYEMDDMLLELPSYHPGYETYKRHGPYIKWILKTADLVIVSTANLRDSATKYTTRPIQLQPNLVSWSLFNAPPKPHNKVFTFLISGTASHEGDWSIIEEPLLNILNIYPEKVRAIFFGDLPEKFSKHPLVQVIKFQDGYEQYADTLKKLNVNCALVPLQDTSFNNCKSNIKWLEYSAAGIPGIYSNTTPYCSSISHGETGLLVDNVADAWFQSMNHLINNPEIALSMVENARTQVRNKFSVESSSGDYDKFIHRIVGQPHQRNFFSEISILPTRLKEQSKACLSAFLNKHLLWRFKQKINS